MCATRYRKVSIGIFVVLQISRQNEAEKEGEGKIILFFPRPPVVWALGFFRVSLPYVELKIKCYGNSNS